jgi:hypothetical protein
VVRQTPSNVGRHDGPRLTILQAEFHAHHVLQVALRDRAVDERYFDVE